MINTEDRVMLVLGNLERQYRGSQATLILHTDGSGAVVLEAHLSLPPKRVAVDFESDDDMESILNQLRQKAATQF